MGKDKEISLEVLKNIRRDVIGMLGNVTFFEFKFLGFTIKTSLIKWDDFDKSYKLIWKMLDIIIDAYEEKEDKGMKSKCMHTNCEREAIYFNRDKTMRWCKECMSFELGLGTKKHGCKSCGKDEN